MKLVSHKNAAEIYERTAQFILSKHHYTEALKIKKEDPYVWSRVGTIEYE